MSSVRTEVKQQQHHETDAESHDLHAALAAATCHIRDSVPPGDADAAAHTLQREHEQPSGEVQDEERDQRTAEQVGDQLEIAEQHVQECRDRRGRDSVDRGVAQRRRPDVLRNTRAGGTPPSCSSGGSAQPTATANAVSGPSTAPCTLAAGAAPL